MRPGDSPLNQVDGSARLRAQFRRLRSEQIADAVRNLVSAGRAAKAGAVLEQALVERPRDPALVALFFELRLRLAPYAPPIDEQQRTATIHALLEVVREAGPLPPRVGVLGATVPLRRFGGDSPGAWQRIGARLSAVPSGSLDLVLCIEQGHTVDPAHSAAFVAQLCRISPCVAFSSALPHQPGFGKVNGRPHRDWIAMFAAEAFLCLDAFRQRLWTRDDVEPSVRQNAFLFVSASQHLRFARWQAPTLVDVYHPLLVNSAVVDHCQGAQFSDQLVQASAQPSRPSAAASGPSRSHGSAHQPKQALTAAQPD